MHCLYDLLFVLHQNYNLKCMRMLKCDKSFMIIDTKMVRLMLQGKSTS